MDKHIRIGREGDNLRVQVDGAVVVEAPCVAGLLSATRDAAVNPLDLDMGTSVAFDLPRSARADLLAALHPASDLLDQLYDQWETAGEPSEFEQEEPPKIETGVTVDDEPWGWIYISKQDEWQLIPVASSKSLFELVLAFEGASMTCGVVFDTGVRRWPTNHGVSWYLEPDDGESKLEVLYEVKNWEDVVWNAVEFDTWPWCPRGNHPVEDDPEDADLDEDDGWTIRFDVDDSIFSERFIGEALTKIWKPCQRHANDQDLSVSVDRRTWTWSGSRWVSTT
jgi:hypothetical protein